MLISITDYAVQTISETSVSLVLSETPYYVVNRQSPIAKLNEIIFHNIVFLIVCLEMFGLLFLVMKLFILPIIIVILKKLKCNIVDKYDSESKETENEQEKPKERKTTKERQIPRNIRRHPNTLDTSNQFHWTPHH
ncbi:unnamed protein product [Adineta ricciae]|nr:unnamed protein product [Adineta ricciae]